MIKPGDHIKSTLLLNESYFEDTQILLTAHDQKGTIGFVINRPYGRSLHELEEFKNTTWPLSEGGPVDQEHIFILHSRPDLISGGQQITEKLYVGGEMRDVVKAINQEKIDRTELQLFIGYCGWDEGELEDEIEEGSWEVVSDW